MEKVRNYVEGLFENAPKSKKNTEIKEELISDLEEKYSDLIKEGKTAKQAYNDVIAGIGDIDEILEKLDESPIKNNMYYEEILKRQKTKGLVISGCVFLYILSIIWIPIAEELSFPEYITVAVFMLIIGISTCIIIYYNVSTPKIQKEEEIVVAKRTTLTKNKPDNAVRGAISSILWTLILIIYFIISFVFNIWHISWVIFIIGGLIESIINLLFSINEDAR